MSLVPQGAFSLSLFRACRGGGCAGAIPKGSSGRFLVQEAHGCFEGQLCRSTRTCPLARAQLLTRLCCRSQGWLLIYGAALQDPSSFIPIYQPGFSSLTPSGGRDRVGKLRHEVAARCQQRMTGFMPLCITKCSCSGSCHNYPGGTGQFHPHQGSISCKR